MATPHPQHDRIAISSPWISRYHDSQLLHTGDGPAGSESIRITDQEVYGNPSHPILFRIGNGGAGYTGVLKLLARTFISTHGNDFRIGWVSNHSRHSQIALLANVVQVALTYEPHNEDVSIAEGWAERVGRVFNDHFILVGPESRRLSAQGIGGALKELAENNLTGEQGVWLFHSRGDGSATFAREQTLWQAAGIDTSEVHPDWIKIDPSTPYDALAKAEKEQAFLLTDRATFLTAKQDVVIPGLEAHIEGGEELLNPCSALVQVNGRSQSHETALVFARWLKGSVAQKILGEYGKDWKARLPLFTGANIDDFDVQDSLVYRLKDSKSILGISQL